MTTQWLLVVMFFGTLDGGMTVQTERLSTKAECELVGSAASEMSKKIAAYWSKGFEWKCIEVSK